jgi:hypothetical protein
VKGQTIGFVLVVIILLAAAVVGFYEYSSINSKYSSLSSSYSALNSTYSALSANYTSLMQKYSSLYKNYTTLEQLYQSLMQKEKQVTTVAPPMEGEALATVMQFYDGIAIESPSDVLPFLASNFTATITGAPFPGTYSLSTFNTTWLADFFSTYETVYFYTTALPNVTKLSNTTYEVTDIVQYFVAPTNDPIYLQVFNASNTITVQYIGGKMLITSLTWKGNEVPPSAVIAGYPSQHQLEANQVLEEYLYEVNALGAEFPGQVTAKYFAPNAVLQINGPLPGSLMNGTYQGLSNIENFFNQWDSDFIFALEYLQNLLPNGTAVPPTVQINLSPNGVNATLDVNDTVIFVFLNQGQPGFPAIYDMHLNVMTYFVYNSTTSMWEITKQIWNVQEVPIPSDTIYYPLGPATFNVVTESTETINATKGGVLTAGNLVVIVQPGTYAYNAKTNMTYSVYNFSVIIFSMTGVYPPNGTDLTPMYAFAFAINGQISPVWSLVNSQGKPMPAYTVVLGATPYWTSWTWFGGTFNGTTYVGGSYKFADHWVYGQDVMVNIQFFKPVIWIFVSSPTPLATPPMPVQLSSVTPQAGLTPVNIYTYSINGQTGGVIMAGNIIVVIKPGTAITFTNGTKLTSYNFSVVFYALSNVPNAPNGGTPVLAFAYAINGYVGPDAVANQSFITVIMTPTNGVTMWTYINGKYLYEDPILVTNGVLINLTFVRPVPWIVTLPELVSNTTTTTSSSSLSTSTYSSSIGYWG